MNSAAIDEIRRDVLGAVPEERRTPHVPSEIDALIREYAQALERGDIRSLLRATTLVHHQIAMLSDDELAEHAGGRLQQLIPAKIKTIAEPLSNKAIFFVWIGAIGVRALRNMAIWQRANASYRVQLWFDSGCLLASHYVRLLRDRFRLGLQTDDDVIRFQNKVDDSINSSLPRGLSVDDALIDVFSKIGDGSIARTLEVERERASQLYAAVEEHIELYDFRDFASTIMDDEFRRYYFSEIGLRANLAAASDILRLHVLQHFGGMYVDCDTLPNLDHVFPRTDAHCREHAISFGFVDVLKSERYLEMVAPLIVLPECAREANDQVTARCRDVQEIVAHLKQHFEGLVECIERDASDLTRETAFKPLSDIRLCHNGLLLSGDPYAQNCFNNNIIIANPRSKAIRLILREMRRRYRHLERMGAIQIASRADIRADSSYDGRLMNYRFDAMDDQPNVTVILTGPGLIFEVMMGLGYSLLKLDDEVPPASLAYALYSPKIGIAFTDQTFYTYDHSQSSWMRGPEGALLV